MPPTIPDAMPEARREAGNVGTLEPGTAWVEAIQKASERIAGLQARSQTPPPESEAARGPDLRPDASAMAGGDPDALLLRAALLTNTGDRAEAEALCRRLLAADELNAGAHYLMALCREHAGDFDAAEEHDQTAIYLDASFAMPWLHRGLLAGRRGRRDEAARCLEHALALLAREEPSRILMFGGGFGREALMQLCRSGIKARGEAA